MKNKKLADKIKQRRLSKNKTYTDLFELAKEKNVGEIALRKVIRDETGLKGKEIDNHIYTLAQLNSYTTIAISRQRILDKALNETQKIVIVDFTEQGQPKYKPIWRA